jgi:adenylyltransferase/sulfurtransferase
VEDSGVDDLQLLRYSRQILLAQIDIEGQQRLLQSRVLIVGLGGLGAPVAMYLAAAGVGTLVLADHDHVDVTNLQRQIIHQTDNVGQAKVSSAAHSVKALNPEVETILIERSLAGQDLVDAVSSVDLVVDCCDNFATRQAVNAVCVAQRRPLV